MNRSIWLLFSAAFLALIAIGGLIGLVHPASASLPGGFSPQAANTGSDGNTGKQSQYSDDFDSLKPAGLKGVSYSTLVNSGKVHVNNASRSGAASSWSNPFAPLLNVVWGNDMLTGSGQGEPAAGIHPSLFNFALISGNFSIDHTTDGGVTWASAAPPNPHNSGDVTNAWLEGGGGGNALELSINLSGGYDYTCGRSTDFGVTWATDAACGPSVSTPFFDDREYIWVDRNPSSPFYGRAYVTTALFDSGGSGSFNTVSNRWSSDNGVSWNPPSAVPIALVPNNEFATGVAHNEYPSLGISPNGTLGYAWRRGLCCGGSPTVGTNDKVMFARSTDGGVTFPFSTTVVSVPANQSISFNSTSPFGQRWSDTPNIAADPTTNGTFYAIWTQYRTASSAASAAVYLSKSTDNGTTWSTPVIPYNNPNGSIFQGFGWVKVTADHTVHMSYFGGTTSNTVGAQFYVQSTDGGATWSAPFQLSATTITTWPSTTDYIADDVSLTGGPGAILAGIEENTGHHARLGTFVAVVGTPTPTVTGTPPTNTPTLTRTNTPTVTPTVCGGASNYSIATATGTVVAGTTDTGNHCDDCNTQVSLPFSFRLYDQTFSNAFVDSDGNLGFDAADDTFTNTCLPDATANYDIFPYWDDLCTGPCATSTCTGCGVFTSVSGTAPNRIFNIEWRADYYNTNTALGFEVRLYENSPTGQFDVVYGTVPQSGSSATVGVQRDTGSLFTQYECNTGGLTAGLLLTFTQPPCNSPTPAPSNTSTATNTPPPTNTSTATNTPLVANTSTSTNTPTNVPGATNTSTPVGPTPTACTVQFTDVPPNSTFYPYIHCLVCLGIVNGYSNGTFRPNADVTRGQLSKIVANSAGFNDTPVGQQFQDVPVGSTFYDYIYRLVHRGYINGYPCGSDPSEPCVPPDNLPYFRPNNPATRGQISKIVSNAAGFNNTPTGQQFQDVPVGSTFYDFIYRLSSRNIINGYACGSVPQEPCVPPQNLPYFRPNNNATRGQMAKIDGLAFFPDCNIAARPNQPNQ